MPYMIGYVIQFEITYIKGIGYFPSFGSVRIVNFTFYVYTNVTNDSIHGVCFPTVNVEIRQIQCTMYLGLISTYVEFC